MWRSLLFSGLILLIAALIILLYRMGSRARQHRELQSRLQTISDLLGEYDGARIEEISTDDPPDYEAPPTYEDVVKAGVSTSTSAMAPPLDDECVLMGKERLGEGRRRARPRPGSTATSSAGLQDESPESSLPPPSISTLLPPPPHTSTRSCQTTPVPDSPPPTYETALLRASHSLSLTQANLLQSTSTPLFNSLSSGQQSGFTSNHSSAPNSLPFMGTLSESPERYLSASENEDGHSTMTDATMLDAVGEFEFLTTDPAAEETSGNENAAAESSGEDGGVVEGEGVEEGKAEEEEQKEGEVDEEVKDNERGDGEAGPSCECVAVESGGTGETVDSENEDGAREEKPEVEEVEEASKESGEGGEDKGETEIAADLPERMPDVIPSEVPSVPDKKAVDDGVVGKEDEGETSGEGKNEESSEGIEETPETVIAVAGTKEEEGSDSEDECSESQKLIVTKGVDEEIEEELEIDEEEILRSLNKKKEEEERMRKGEVKGESEKERKKEMKRGYSEGGKDARIKEEAILGGEDVLVGADQNDWENDSGVVEDGPKISSPHKDAVTHPHEIVGGIVKGHIKLFQSMSNKEEEEEGDTRVVRRRVAMRGWRSVDVGYGGERLLED